MPIMSIESNLLITLQKERWYLSRVAFWSNFQSQMYPHFDRNIASVHPLNTGWLSILSPNELNLFGMIDYTPVAFALPLDSRSDT